MQETSPLKLRVSFERFLFRVLRLGFWIMSFGMWVIGFSSWCSKLMIWYAVAWFGIIRDGMVLENLWDMPNMSALLGSPLTFGESLVSLLAVAGVNSVCISIIAVEEFNFPLSGNTITPV